MTKGNSHGRAINRVLLGLVPALLSIAVFNQDVAAADNPPSVALATCFLLGADPDDSTTLGQGVWAYDLDLTAASQACAAAQQAYPTNPTVIYIQGRLALVAGNYSAAVRNFEQAENLGYISATARLADMYFEGLGVPKNPARAQGLLDDAAAHGDPHSQAAIAMQILSEISPSTEELLRSRHLAEESATEGAPDGLFARGILQLRGVAGYKADKEKALEDLMRASDLGLLDARYAAARLLLGMRSPAAITKAISLLESASAHGHKKSQSLLEKLENQGAPPPPQNEL